MNGNYIYEVETRFYFKNEAEVYKLLPFVKDSFQKNIIWETWHFGENLHKEDIILRLNKSIVNNNKIYYMLCFKEKDISESNLINIRKEYEEDISDGFISNIYANNLKGECTLLNKDNVMLKLSILGYSEFMSFSGRSLIGFLDDWKLSIKLMFCKFIEFPVILEIEREAKTKNDISQLIYELMEFSNKYNLINRIVNDEPPTLLYKSIKNNTK